jgi:hypothetical protein
MQCFYLYHSFILHLHLSATLPGIYIHEFSCLLTVFKHLFSIFIYLTVLFSCSLLNIHFATSIFHLPSFLFAAYFCHRKGNDFSLSLSVSLFTFKLDGFGVLVVSILATETRVRGFKPGRSRWIFRASKNPQYAFLPSEGK